LRKYLKNASDPIGSLASGAKTEKKNSPRGLDRWRFSEFLERVLPGRVHKTIMNKKKFRKTSKSICIKKKWERNFCKTINFL
jgi:hypothetical protein